MKRKVKLGIIAVVIVIYAARICVPYTKQGEVTEETEAGFSKADFL
ncbi:hypothetical protein [Hungatella hathewayi]|uniref:Uncharacterized protein n=1 Tax=Hungatella hathewayi WAL-18680 TaxID=742737 RepID=G5IH12_9FIRM|nr:hypothetical protein [Hungatella hathewayi]EHI59233.1 hypothetical protein HMPREF9473_02790 [ [Hungatella hathewayi WAL-18680]